MKLREKLIGLVGHEVYIEINGAGHTIAVREESSRRTPDQYCKILEVHDDCFDAVQFSVTGEPFPFLRTYAISSFASLTVPRR